MIKELIFLMKLNYFNLSISVVTLFLALAVSCRKPDKPGPGDPCKNLVSVYALDQSETGGRGQFLYDDPDGHRYFLNAENYADYSSKLVPGLQYKIAFKVVACTKCPTNENPDRIAPGGCIIYETKCIRILCLQEVKSCFETRLDVQEFDNEVSQCNSVIGITGDRLDVNITYSGCSSTDNLTYTLDLREMPRRCLGGSPVYEAKVVNQFKGYTCKPLFNRNICFDLTTIKNYYLTRNAAPPESVLLRVIINGQYQELTYKL